MTYPFAGLAENLAAFCATLRREHGFRVGPRELMDAAHALELAEITNQRAVRDALRAILAKTSDDVQAFDPAFDRFFHGGGDVAPPGKGLESAETAARQSGEPTTAIGGAHAPHTTTETLDIDGHPVHVGDVRPHADAVIAAPAVLLRASYSPLAGEAALVLAPPTRAWLDAAAAFARRVQTAASRRWQPAVRGPRFDFRRTLRKSLHTGGEPVVPRWRAHPRRRSRFVLLIDGSRSMGESARPALHTAVALSAVSPATETFAFSTMLWRITRDTRRAAGGEMRTLHVAHAWGGGTTIGACLDEFLRRHAERLLGRDTVVIVASDGLDIGRPDLLGRAVAQLARRSAGVVWLNPLLATPGYEPTAAGMRLARPHVAALAAVRDPAGLRSLSRALRIARRV